MNTATAAFLAARDLLFQLRDDHLAATQQFRWPRLQQFNWALDHFDVTGAWRIKDRGVPVNSAGMLYDGTKLNGATELRAALMKRSEVIVTHFTEMLMAYAIGRRVEYFDMPTIRGIVRRAAPGGYRMSDLILGVANSPAFRTARAETIDAASKH